MELNVPITVEPARQWRGEYQSSCSDEINKLAFCQQRPDILLNKFLGL
jgi:hypothetical protein